MRHDKGVLASSRVCAGLAPCSSSVSSSTFECRHFAVRNRCHPGGNEEIVYVLHRRTKQSSYQRPGDEASTEACPLSPTPAIYRHKHPSVAATHFVHAHFELSLAAQTRSVRISADEGRCGCLTAESADRPACALHCSRSHQ